MSGQAARDALDTDSDDKEPAVRAARILADAIDRLTVALCGTDKDYDNGALGWISSSLDSVAERSHDGLTDIAAHLTGSMDRVADAIDTYDARTGGSLVTRPDRTSQGSRHPRVPRCDTCGEPMQHMGVGAGTAKKGRTKAMKAFAMGPVPAYICENAKCKERGKAAKIAT